MNNIKKIAFLIFSILFGNAIMSAQSADVITSILESSSATFGQVCYLSAVQQNLISEDASFDEAIQVLYNNNQLIEKEASESPATYSDISFIFSHAWKINGGLMFRLFKNSQRYAFKQFRSDGIISSSSDPGKIASGTDLLNILLACISKYGDFDINSVDMEG